MAIEKESEVVDEPLTAPTAAARSTVLCQIDDFDLAAFTAVAAAFGSERYGYVVTPNVDQLIRYYEDHSFRTLYRTAEYVLLDSRVVALAMRVLKRLRLTACPGSDLTAELFGRVASCADHIVLVGGSAAQARQLAAIYGLANVHHHNPPMGFISDGEATEACLRYIESKSPFRFCFLAVGSPQQEMIAQSLQARGRARGLVLCVGAALDFLTGAQRRAPRLMQRMALEWLYRLRQDPRRLARRYLVRDPWFFMYLLRGRLVLRQRRVQVDAHELAHAEGLQPIEQARGLPPEAVGGDVEDQAA